VSSTSPPAKIGAMPYGNPYRTPPMADPVPLTLDANVLSDWQACRRRSLLAADWRPLRWRPKSLLDACLRRGILELSSARPRPVAEIASDAKSTLLQTAASPGLDVDDGTNPYKIAKDLCAMLDTILHAISRMTLLVLADAPPVPLSSILTWRPTSPVDESGVLHRWITVDRWDHPHLVRELHSWRTFGDIAILRAPLTLHVIVIGQNRDGRRASSWARGWRHAAMPNTKIHFRKKDGTAFNGTWKPVYFADDINADADAWVDQMLAEGAVGELIQHVPIAVPAESVCLDTVRQLMYEGVRIRDAHADAAVDWSGWPMSRAACDGLAGPCPFQYLCYSAEKLDPATTGMYQRRRPLAWESKQTDKEDEALAKML